jgi:hypothetical protein
VAESGGGSLGGAVTLWMCGASRAGAEEADNERVGSGGWRQARGSPAAGERESGGGSKGRCGGVQRAALGR